MERKLPLQHKVASRWELLAVSALLLVLLAAFFWRAVFLGKKLVPADLAYADPMFSSAAPAGFTTPHNALLYDLSHGHYPWHVYISQAIRQGFLPFWNPYVYCGTPLLAQDLPAVFYPLNILSYALPPADAALFTALAGLFIAGLATYGFVRIMGGNLFGAVVGAITFAFGGFLTVWSGYALENVAVWLPAFFLTAEWLYRKPNVPRMVLLALVVACQLTGGHSQTALYALTAGGVYYLARVVGAWRCSERERPEPTGARLLLFGLAALLGAALAMVHILPFWEWAQGSAEFASRMSSENLRMTRPGPKYWLAGIPPILLPNVFGNPTWPGRYRSFLAGSNFAEQALYVGIIGLSLAVTQIAARGRERRVRLMACLGLVALALALRLPLVDALNYLPLFSIAHPGRFRLVFTFCMSVLAGLGASELVVDQGKHSRLLMRVLMASASLGLVLLFVLRWLFHVAYATAEGEAGQMMRNALSQAFSPGNFMMYWPLLIALAAMVVLVLYRRGVLGSRIMQAVLLLLVTVDLFAFGMNYHSTVEPTEIFPETPALHLLKTDTSIFRIIGTENCCMPNAGMLHGLYDVRGFGFPSSLYMQFSQAIGGQSPLGYNLLFSGRLQPKLLGLLNVKYILTSSKLDPGILSYLREVHADKDIRIYENLAWLPRSFIVHRVRVSKDVASTLAILQDPDFDLRSEIVLAAQPPAGWETAGAASPEASAEITRYEPNRVTIRASTSDNAFLFLSDSYAPGWRGYIDGAETEVYQADHAFRAVYLPSGQHTVEFAYQPRSFHLALTVTLSAIVIVVVLLAGTWWRSTHTHAEGV